MRDNIRLIVALVRRDLNVYRSRFLPFIVQYAGIYPLLYGTCFGYLMPKIGMSASTMESSTILVGTIAMAFPAVGFAFTNEFLFDFDRDRLSDFYLIRMPAFVYVLQNIITKGIFIFFCLAPYYASMKLMFGSVLDLTRASWWQAFFILFLASCYQASLLILFASYAPGMRALRHFWRRVNYPMIMLGGFLVPWYIMKKFSLVLGYCVLVNPVLAITEGMRFSLLGGSPFLPLWYTATLLVVVTIMCTTFALYFFKRKVDHL